jgi:hypothetical protein
MPFVFTTETIYTCKSTDYEPILKLQNKSFKMKFDKMFVQKNLSYIKRYLVGGLAILFFSYFLIYSFNLIFSLSPSCQLEENQNSKYYFS